VGRIWEKEESGLALSRRAEAQTSLSLNGSKIHLGLSLRESVRHSMSVSSARLLFWPSPLPDFCACNF
jgi:hypothetical protein